MYSVISYLCLAISLLASCGVLAWPDPEPFKGTIRHNDRGITMDPALMRRGSDDKLFLFTTGKHKGGGYVWTAPSIRGPWTKSAEPAFDEPWNAPYAHFYSGTYYLYYTNNQFDDVAAGVQNPGATKYWHGSSISVRSSKTMDPGSWKAHGRLTIPWNMRYNVLDGALVTVKQNEGPFRPARAPACRTCRLSSRVTHLARNGTAEGAGHPDPTEAGFVWRRGEFFYLFFSSGRCTREPDDYWASAGNAYKVMVCRFRSPDRDYRDQHGKDCAAEAGGTMILGSHGNVWAPGGQGVMIFPEVGGPIIYYHYVPIDPETKKP